MFGQCVFVSLIISFFIGLNDHGNGDSGCHFDVVWGGDREIFLWLLAVTAAFSWHVNLPAHLCQRARPTAARGGKVGAVVAVDVVLASHGCAHAIDHVEYEHTSESCEQACNLCASVHGHAFVDHDARDRLGHKVHCTDNER